MSLERKTFALVHGSWHDRWCWELLQAELGMRGHDTVAMDIPVDDPSKNFDDYGHAVADALRDSDHIVGVFHSRAGNYGPRGVNELLANPRTADTVERMIFLSSSLEPATLAALGKPSPGETVPARNDLEFKDAIVLRPDLGPDMTLLDQACAVELLYHDVAEADLVMQALSHLRPQHRPKLEPSMQQWPAVPQHYIICADDRVVRPEWSYYVTRNWLGIEPVEMGGGHSPFLSRPNELADVLISIACAEQA